jgi:Cu-Zn family superoxide dismutase
MRKLAATLPLVVTLSLAAPHAQQPQIAQYPLPADVTYPEGIAYDAKNGAIITGSAATTSIVRMPVESKQATVISPDGAIWAGDAFPALLGMKVDGAGRLWISGGRTGRIGVVDSKTGKLIKRLETPAQPAGLINDVAIAGSDAYFTDTLRPTLWRVSVKGGQVGEVEPWLQFTGTAIDHSQAPNLNGIAATPDGRSLIVVHMGKGLLFRIDTADKRITPIDTGGEALNTADGLVLDGRTLYVVRQGEQEIVTVQLSDDLAKGKVVSRFKNPALMWPATAAKVGDRLLVVNTQFNKRNTKDPVLPFSIVGVPVSMLAGK